MKASLIPLTCLGIFSFAVQAQNPPAAPVPSARQQACKADVQKFCSGVQPGGGRIIACLNTHRGELLTACQEALPRGPAQPVVPKDNGAPDPASRSE
jgi:flavoprotein